MNRPLFREEAVKNKATKPHGSIILTRTWSNALLAAFLCTIVGILVLFAFNFSFARKATANGVIVPSKGITRVLAPQDGTVAKRVVTEGQEVRIGDPLFTISSERNAESGGVQVAVRESLIARIDKLNRELDQQGGQTSNRQREISDRLDSHGASMRQLEHELELQRNKVRIARDIAARVAELAKSGNMSKISAAEKEADLLDQESRLSALEGQRQAALREITALQSTRTDFEKRHIGSIISSFPGVINDPPVPPA